MDGEFAPFASVFHNLTWECLEILISVQQHMHRSLFVQLASCSKKIINEIIFGTTISKL